jgi:ubiquinone/menaquinone biosynthesis C-methylase UbiE
MFNRALALNSRNIYSMLEVNPEAKLLDLGCFEGAFTVKMGDYVGTKKLYGIDVEPSVLQKAKKRGIQVKQGNLNVKFPYQSNFFDIVHGNQVIEHIYDSDMFLSEIYRILKPGGYAIISTENASSWVNIIASIMGWQIFSLTNISARRLGIGNPLAMFRLQKIRYASFGHMRVYNFYGLKEYLEVMGFTVERIAGAGYFPFPNWMGNVDRVHAHFITFKVRKK